MITRGIRELMDRDWGAVRENKDAYWAARIGNLGPAEAFRIGDQLRRMVLLIDPAWPDAESRRADLDAHTHWVRLLRRADSARCR